LHEPFVEQLKNPNVLAKHWCHLLSAHYDYNTVEARMQFFAGPKLRPIVWQVALGASPSRVVGTFQQRILLSLLRCAGRRGLRRRHDYAPACQTLMPDSSGC
jgi:hypothetical protein